jgi:hypothetical protein
MRPDLRETEEENEFEYAGDWGNDGEEGVTTLGVETKVRWFVVGQSPLVGRGSVPICRSGSLNLRGHLEPKRVQRDKTGRIRLVIRLGRISLHSCDIRAI